MRGVEVAKMSNIEYICDMDTASNFVVVKVWWPGSCFRRFLDDDTTSFDECGPYFAQKIDEALSEEKWENFPKFNTVEELFEELDN